MRRRPATGAPGRHDRDRGPPRSPGPMATTSRRRRPRPRPPGSGSPPPPWAGPAPRPRRPAGDLRRAPPRTAVGRRGRPRARSRRRPAWRVDRRPHRVRAGSTSPAVTRRAWPGGSPGTVGRTTPVRARPWRHAVTVDGEVAHERDDGVELVSEAGGGTSPRAQEPSRPSRLTSGTPVAAATSGAHDPARRMRSALDGGGHLGARPRRTATGAADAGHGHRLGGDEHGRTDVDRGPEETLVGEPHLLEHGPLLEAPPDRAGVAAGEERERLQQRRSVRRRSQPQGPDEEQPCRVGVAGGRAPSSSRAAVAARGITRGGASELPAEGRVADDHVEATLARPGTVEGVAHHDLGDDHVGERDAGPGRPRPPRPPQDELGPGDLDRHRVEVDAVERPHRDRRALGRRRRRRSAAARRNTPPPQLGSHTEAPDRRPRGGSPGRASSTSSVAAAEAGCSAPLGGAGGRGRAATGAAGRGGPARERPRSARHRQGRRRGRSRPGGRGRVRERRQQRDRLGQATTVGLGQAQPSTEGIGLGRQGGADRVGRPTAGRTWARSRKDGRPGPAGIRRPRRRPADPRR